MSTESGERPLAEKAGEGAAAAGGRVAALIVILAVIVAAGLLLLRQEGMGARPLSPPGSRSLIVLLAPGASLSDWRDAAVMPSVAGDVSGTGISDGRAAAVGLLPAGRDGVPWRAEVGGGGALWAPVTTGDLVRASRTLGGPPLGTALRRGGARVIALGADPAARSFVGEPPVAPPGAVAPLTSYEDQDVEQWRSRRPDAVDGFVTDPDRLADAISRALAPSPSAPRLVVATYDDLLRNDAYAPLSLAGAVAVRRREALHRLDRLILRLTGGASGSVSPVPAALLVLTPVAAVDAAARGDLLGPALYWPGSDAPPLSGRVLLTSPSTRHAPGLLAPGDIAPTIASLLGLPETGHGSSGRPAEIRSTEENLAVQSAVWAEQLRARYALIGLPWALAGLLLVAAFVRSPNHASIPAALGLAVCAAPLTLLCCPPGALAGGVFGGSVLLVVGIVGALMARRGGGAAAGAISALRVLSLLTTLALALLVTLDGASGGLALAHCPLSYAPALGARYYGLGNELSGVLLGASLAAVAALGEPGTLGIVLGGAAIALLMGLPSLGADAGGFAAALIAYGTWVALSLRERRGAEGSSGRTVAGVGAALLLLVVLFLWGNGALPEGTRTHVGQTVEEARLGGVGAFSPTLLRKASADARLLVTSPWSALLLTEAVLTGWLWRRHGLPGGVEGQAVVAACAGAGTLLLLNDSGSAAAATCLLYPTARLLLSAAD